MSLARAPSDRELRQLATARQLARFGRILDPVLLDDDARATTVALPTYSRAYALHGYDVTRGQGYTVAAQPDAGMSAPIRARREGDTLWLDLETAPRTKKNHGSAFGIRQSVPYKKFRADVIGAVLTVKTVLQLPLPDQAYNIAVRYIVDRYGQRADRPGLDQGLFDALQDAGVVSDDWFFRRTEGTEIVAVPEDERPRAEIVITPLVPVEVL